MEGQRNGQEASSLESLGSRGRRLPSPVHSTCGSTGCGPARPDSTPGPREGVTCGAAHPAGPVHRAGSTGQWLSHGALPMPLPWETAHHLCRSPPAHGPAVTDYFPEAEMASGWEKRNAKPCPHWPTPRSAPRPHAFVTTTSFPRLHPAGVRRAVSPREHQGSVT